MYGGFQLIAGLCDGRLGVNGPGGLASTHRLRQRVSLSRSCAASYSLTVQRRHLQAILKKVAGGVHCSSGRSGRREPRRMTSVSAPKVISEMPTTRLGTRHVPAELPTPGRPEWIAPSAGRGASAKMTENVPDDSGVTATTATSPWCSPPGGPVLAVRPRGRGQWRSEPGSSTGKPPLGLRRRCDLRCGSVIGLWARRAFLVDQTRNAPTLPSRRGNTPMLRVTDQDHPWKRSRRRRRLGARPSRQASKTASFWL